MKQALRCSDPLFVRRQALRQIRGVLTNPAHRDHLVSVASCCERLGVGRTKTYDLVTKGALVLVKVGSRSFIIESSLDAFIAALPRGPGQPGHVPRAESSKVAKRKIQP